MFQPGDEVWLWCSSTKNNEPNEWVPAQVVEAKPHYLEVRRLKMGSHAVDQPRALHMRTFASHQGAKSLGIFWQ